MSTIPTIQLFRNSNLVTGRDAAVNALEGQKGNVPDGGLILARYSADGTENAVKTILGIVRNNGDNSYISIFDVEGAAENVATAITNAISKLDKIDNAVDGQYVAAVSETDGIISVSRKALPSLTTQSSSGKAVTAITQSNGLVSVAFGGVAAANVSVADASGKFTADNVEAVLSEIQNSLDSAIGQGGSVGTQISNAINELDSSKSGSTTHVSVKVDQVDGKISAVTVSENDIASAALLGTTADTSTATTAFGKIAKEAADRAAAINALNLTSVGGTGKVITTVSQNNGQVSAIATDLTAANVGATVLTGTTTAVAVNGDTVAAQISSLAKSIKSVSSDAKTYTISAITSGLESNVEKAYGLFDEDGVQAGSTIKIYKDSSLKGVVLNGQSLDFTYILADGSESTVGVDVSTFLAESEFSDGLQVVNHVVSVKKDSSSEPFLTVSGSGVKVSGIQSAINTATGSVNTAIDARLGTGVTTDATATAQFTALKGTTASTSADTSVYGAKTYAKNYADSKIASLDATVTSVSGTSTTEAIKIVQTDGMISSITLGTFDCGVY